MPLRVNRRRDVKPEVDEQEDSRSETRVRNESTHQVGRTAATLDRAWSHGRVAIRAHLVVRGDKCPAVRAHSAFIHYMGIVPSTLVRTLLLLTVRCGIALAQAQPDDGLHYSPERERMAIELRTRTQALHFIAAGWDIAVLLLLM